MTKQKIPLSLLRIASPCLMYLEPKTKARDSGETKRSAAVLSRCRIGAHPWRMASQSLPVSICRTKKNANETSASSCLSLSRVVQRLAQVSWCARAVWAWCLLGVACGFDLDVVVDLAVDAADDLAVDRLHRLGASLHAERALSWTKM
jgi:hypothetical protein